jgi:regulator of sigma E protease
LQWGDDYGWEFDPEGITNLVYPGPAEQLEKSALAIYEMIRAISSRKSNISIQHMSGPVMMVHAYYSFFTFFQAEYGWRYAIWFSVVLNVNLAILNLLPIPPLDGSHITLSIIEAIRRRPVSGHIVEYVQTACTVAIIGFMLYIVFFDVQDLPFFSKESGVKFSGKPTTPAAATNK